MCNHPGELVQYMNLVHYVSEDKSIQTADQQNTEQQLNRIQNRIAIKYRTAQQNAYQNI